MVTLDLAQALSRFIVPVLMIFVIAYIFRLFGFGWRIFKPAPRRSGKESTEDAFRRQLDLIRNGDFAVYVERMREEIARRVGDDPEFSRLRKEFLRLVSTGSNRRDEKVSREIDRVVVEMVDMYTRLTGKEGISFTSGRSW